jgi:hypothetical protein
MYHFYSYYKIDWWTIYRVEFNIYLMFKPQMLVARTYHPPFSNFLFTNLFSIKFPYVFIISSLFPYLNLFVSIFMQSLIMLTLNCMCRPYIDTNNPQGGNQYSRIDWPIDKPRVSSLLSLNTSAVIRYLICVYASHFFAGNPYHFIQTLRTANKF